MCRDLIAAAAVVGPQAACGEKKKNGGNFAGKQVTPGLYFHGGTTAALCITESADMHRGRLSFVASSNPSALDLAGWIHTDA